MSVRSTRLYGILKMLESLADELEDLASETNVLRYDAMEDDLRHTAQLVSDAAVELREMM